MTLLFFQFSNFHFNPILSFKCFIILYVVYAKFLFHIAGHPFHKALNVLSKVYLEGTLYLLILVSARAL